MDYCIETNSPVFRKALAFCAKVADSNVNILLIGESGTGKEMAARYIHQLSGRRDKRFVAVNCSAYSETLLESELFGHERGAFTGAVKTKEGKLEQAHEGTLFLDEIGDTNPVTQVKLLRVIETKHIEPVGSSTPRHIDFRLITATNKDLREAIGAAVFREDFFYRISTVAVRIPPLRERREDLEILIPFFLEKSQAANKKEIQAMVSPVRRFLFEYDYPGNIRELKNIIDRLVILSEGGVITEDCLPILYAMPTAEEQAPAPGPARLAPPPPYPDFGEFLPLRTYKQQAEAGYLAWALQQTNGNVAAAARRLGISRRQLFNKISDYQLKK